MANKELTKLFKDYWANSMEFSPSTATFLGVRKYNDRLEDLSYANEKKYLKFIREFRARLKKIPARNLNKQELLSKKILARNFELFLEATRYPTRYLAIDQMSGFHLHFLLLANVHPFKTKKDFNDFLKRLRAFCGQIIQVEKHLIAGLKKNWIITKPVIEAVIPQLKGLSASPPGDSQFFQIPDKNLKNLKKGKKEIREKLLKIVSEEVIPGLKKLVEFLEKKYLPLSRNSVGFCGLPGGIDYYQLCIKSHTTTEYSADSIHEIGKKELKRIHAEMKKIKEKLGFKGKLLDFFYAMRNNKKMHYESRKEIITDHRNLLNKMQKKLPLYFNRLPVNPFRVIPMEAYQEKASPDAMYQPGNFKTGRKGTYFVNTYQPETRTRYTAESLAFHEAIPGHHLQTALAQELKGIPEFRKCGGVNAFVEGWALYAEKLSREMGFMQSPEAQFGALSFEAWRACRLVIDTGLHAKGWTRSRAIKYFKKNTSLSEENINVEVDRYLVMPGQALSYKLGEMFISSLRKKIEKKLGQLFDLKKFHDRLLSNGAIPLPFLAEIMEEWADTQKK
ncbi:DUF885 family protein [Candidatus Riflebacteria bacterium]